MLASSYDTTAARMYKTDKIRRELTEMLIRGELWNPPRSADSGKIRYVIDGRVPSFNHPILIKDVSGEEEVIVIDARSFTRVSRDGSLVVSSGSDEKVAILRAAFELAAHDPELGNYNLLYTASEIPFYLFVTWVSENLTQRMALTPEEQVKTSIVAAYYYYFMHQSNDTPFGEREFIKVATRLSNVLRIPVAKTLEYQDKIRRVVGLGQFIELLQDVLNTPKLEQLNLGVAVTIFASSAGWRGVQAKEIVAVGLEHAPTWHAIVIAAITEANQNKTRLAKTVKRYRGREKTDGILRYYSELDYFDEI